MENDLQGGDSPSVTSRPSPAEARASLSHLESDGARLAERVVTPRWYHPTLGAIVALILCTQALPAPGSLVTLPFALFALPVLVVVYRRRYGVWVSQPAGPRSRRILRTLGTIVLLAFAASLVIKLTAIEYVWVLLPAAVGFVVCVVLGPRYDAALRSELSGAGREDT